MIRDLRSLSGSAVPLLIANVVNAGISSLIMILIARYLSPTTYGIYAILLGILQSSLSLFTAGLTTWSVREISREIGRTSMVVASLLTIMAGAGVTTLIAVLITVMVVEVSIPVLLALIFLALQITFRNVGDVFVSALISVDEAKPASVANLSGTVMSAVLVPLVLIGGLGIAGLAGAQLLATMVRMVLSRRLLAPFLITDGRNSVSFGGAKWALRSSRQFWLAQSSFSLATRLQPTVIGYTDTLLAGLYAFGQRLLEASMFAISPINAVLVAHIARSLTDGRQRLRRFLFLAVVAGMLGAVIGLLIVAAAHTVLPSLIGTEYRAVYAASWLIGVAVVFLFIAQIMNAYLVALGMEKFFARTSFIGSITLLGGLGSLSRLGSLQTLFGYLVAWNGTITLVWALAVWRRLRQKIKEGEDNDESNRK